MIPYSFGQFGLVSVWSQVILYSYSYSYLVSIWSMVILYSCCHSGLLSVWSMVILYSYRKEQDWLLNECENDPNKFWKSIGEIVVKQEKKVQNIF